MEKHAPRRLRAILALALPLIGFTAQAGATASLTCSAADRNLSFELLGNLGSGNAGSVQLIGGTITLKAIRGKFGALEFKIEAGHLSGQWNFGKELRVGIEPANAGDVSIYLAIIAERAKRPGADLDHYRGRYVAKIHGPKGKTELTGAIKGCEAG